MRCGRSWDSNVLCTEMSPDGLESTPLVDRMPNSVKSNETAFICGHPNDPIPKSYAVRTIVGFECAMHRNEPGRS